MKTVRKDQWERESVCELTDLCVCVCVRERERALTTVCVCV